MAHKGEDFAGLGLFVVFDQETGGFREDEERGENEKGGGHHLHGEWDLPLPTLGRGDVFVDDVVAPVTDEGGELVVDLVDTDERTSDSWGADFCNILDSVVSVNEGVRH